MAFTNFNSITGLALSPVNKGEIVKVSYRLNCKDEIQELDRFAIARRNLDDLVYPEIIKRIKKGLLSTNFRLRKAHIIMFSNEHKNHILLNGRTRFLVQVKVKEGVGLNQPIGENEIEDVLGIYPMKQNDPNAAHIMLFKFKGNWLISYDFIYNSKKARDNIEKAKKEFKDSEKFMKEKKLMSFVRKQFRAVKLCIQSLLGLNNSKLSLKTNAASLEQLFSAYANHKNIDIKFSDHFKQLVNLHKKDVGSVNEYFVDNQNAHDIINLTKDLIEHTENVLDSVNFHRNPPSGIYLKK